METTASSRVRPALLYSSLIILALLALTSFLQLRNSPATEALGTDSGLFAYTGGQIAQGKLLYRDVWDEKPPAVYYLDALAILLVGPNPWAIWLLNLVWMAAAASAFYLILARLVGRLSALLGTLVFLITAFYPDYFLGGNFTEVYALLPQVLSIGAFARYTDTGRRGWLVVLGSLTALAFLCKPNYIAIGLACFAVVLYRGLRQRRFRQVTMDIGAGLLGLALPLAITAIYFAAHGALQEMLYAVFTYNIEYARQGFSLRSLYSTGLTLAVVQPLASVFTISLAGAVVFIVQNRRPLLHPVIPESAQSSATWVFAAVILALPLEWAFVSISGKNFGHYFLTPLPAMAAACTYLIAEIRRAIPHSAGTAPWSALSLAVLGVLALVWGVKSVTNVVATPTQIKGFFQALPTGRIEPNKLQQYVIANSRPDQSVLVWGTHTDINFVTGRRSPTRYPFTLPLLVDSPQTRGRFSEYMASLEANPPALILAQPNASSGVPYFNAPAASFCPGCSPDVRSGLTALKQFVDEHYVLDLSLWDWVVYKYAK